MLLRSYLFDREGVLVLGVYSSRCFRVLCTFAYSICSAVSFEGLSDHFLYFKSELLNNCI